MFNNYKKQKKYNSLNEAPGNQVFKGKKKTASETHDNNRENELQGVNQRKCFFN